ncbi:hypothetical protein [Inconstantimicrobium porci]|uniref:hypothetical protein n=1 Tax=Inconstantimicrobium porci TaxID=2652291 RepID=UPI002408F3A0|nr:hypothetical protein [Inconstantimicrobium porci]MDD6769670.1 hypothetical protein [Inconstantimicrobium porci]
MVDIIDIAEKNKKLVRVNNSKDYVKLMKFAERKGYTWFSGAKPINKRYDKKIGLPLLISFFISKDRKCLNFSKKTKYDHINYESKRGNTLW